MSPPVPYSSLLWRTGAAFAAVGMITGAFGAHGLKKHEGITPDQVRSWETAAHYAVFNGLGLLAISLHPRFAVHRFAGPAIALGGAVFSTTIFALVLNRDRFKFLGPITPLGGLVMISG
ncbi:duf423 domain-containing protein [Moniliophthora roreri MCA 2997]|uniref:Duf423 domain-containing protein n=1 Tax=Moniliophthora roreri (strain MCA 2997) TaxID=1381753 RepID=V2XGH7_MONRO|nr:duf423 domain-containing protein [Moniliophthora roreri MCA 2997]